jgi:hypothetical protein
MDVGTFVLGGIFTAAIGLLTRLIESLLDHRRELDRLRAGKAMDIRLADIDMTRFGLHSGWIAEARRVGTPADVIRFWPTDTVRPSQGNEAAEYLTEKTLLEFENVLELLKNLPDGAGLRPAFLKRITDLKLDIDLDLDTAREAVLAGDEVPMLSPSTVKRIYTDRTGPLWRGLGVGEPPSGG